MTYPKQPVVRVEFHSEDGTRTILSGDALTKWEAASTAVGGLWASRDWGDPGFSAAWGLATTESPIHLASLIDPTVCDDAPEGAATTQNVDEVTCLGCLRGALKAEGAVAKRLVADLTEAP